MERIFILAALFILPIASFAQVRLSTSVGYGTYAMKELREHQFELKDGWPVDAKTTSSFPGYLTYQLGADYSLKNNFRIGLSFSYGSTGGLVHYRDYSGELGFEHKVRYFSYGCPIIYQLDLTDARLNLQFEFSPSINFGTTKYDSYLNLGTVKSEYSANFKSTNVGSSQSVRIERKVGPAFIFAQAGYYLDLYKSKLEWEEDRKEYLSNGLGEPVRMELSGMRVALGVAYVLR